MIGNVGATGPGVLKEFRDIRSKIGVKETKTPAIQPRALPQEQDPQFPRSQINGNKWMLKMKKLREKRQTSRPEPTPGVSPRPVNQRANTGAIDQNYNNSGALVEDRRAGKRMGKDAGAGPR